MLCQVFIASPYLKYPIFVRKLVQKACERHENARHEAVRTSRADARIATLTIVPQVNQIEFNPFQNPQDLVKFCQKTGIAQWGNSISTRTIKNIQVISKIQ